MSIARLAASCRLKLAAAADTRGCGPQTQRRDLMSLTG
jgi:hypothetical protein